MTRNQLLKALALSGGGRSKELARTLGSSRNAVTQHLVPLQKDGLVHAESYGFYVLTDRGRTAIGEKPAFDTPKPFAGIHSLTQKEYADSRENFGRRGYALSTPSSYEGSGDAPDAGPGAVREHDGVPSGSPGWKAEALKWEERYVKLAELIATK